MKSGVTGINKICLFVLIPISQEDIYFEVAYLIYV